MSNFSVTISGDSAAALAANVAIVAALLATGSALPAAAAVQESAPAPAGGTKSRSRAKPPEDKAQAETPAVAAAAAPAAPPAAAPAAAAITKDVLVGKLVALINTADAAGKNGKQVCTDLCMKFGGRNASALDPSQYGPCGEAADKLREEIASDPTA